MLIEIYYLSLDSAWGLILLVIVGFAIKKKDRH